MNSSYDIETYQLNPGIPLNISNLDYGNTYRFYLEVKYPQELRIKIIIEDYEYYKLHRELENMYLMELENLNKINDLDYKKNHLTYFYYHIDRDKDKDKSIILKKGNLISNFIEVFLLEYTPSCNI